MGFVKGFAVLVVLLSTAGSGDALKCFTCKGVDSIDKCTATQTCGPDEHCHAEQIMDSTGATSYSLNCKPKTLCTRLEQDDQPSDGIEIEIWTSCCATDFCNIYFDKDGDLIAASKRVLTCYNCQGIADPADCTTVATCKPGEACLTHEVVSGNSKVFDMGCLPKMVCESVGHHLHLSKRKRHTKRFELCRGCCDERSRCNNQFCSAKLGLTDMNALGTPIVPNYTPRPTVPGTTSAPVTTTAVSASAAVTPDNLSSLNLLIIPANQSAPTASTVVFDCEFDKPINLTMTVTWYFTDKTGHTKQIYTGDVNPPALDFYVKRLELADAGEYTCEVKYGTHTWSKKAHLEIESGFVEVLKGPETQAVQTGQKATFICNVSGTPQPTIRWEFIHNSHVQTITAGVTKTTSGSQLVIDSVTKDNDGVYKCIATNAYDVKEALAVLTVS